MNHKIKEMIKTDNALKKEIMRLMKDSDSLLELGDKMSQCCEGIENALKELYPDCKAYPFGSRVTGLGNIVRFFLFNHKSLILKFYNEKLSSLLYKDHSTLKDYGYLKLFQKL